MSLALFFCLRIALATWDPYFWFCTKFKFVSSVSVKNAIVFYILPWRLRWSPCPPLSVYLSVMVTLKTHWALPLCRHWMTSFSDLSYEVSTIVIPILRWRNRGSQKWSHLSKVTQLLSGGVKTWTQIVWANGPCSALGRAAQDWEKYIALPE